MLALLIRLFILPPIVLIGTLNLIIAPSVLSFLFLLVLIALNYFINEIGRIEHGVNLINASADKLNKVLNTNKLTPIDNSGISNFITQTGKLILKSRYRWQKKTSGKKRDFFTKKERPIDELPIKIFKIEDNLPFSYRCYANHYTWNIIITNLEFSEMTATQKFLILHEVGHSTFENVSLYARKFSAKMEGIFLLLITILTLGLKWLLIIYAPIIFIFYLRLYDRATVKAEVNADIWALHQFNDLTKLKQIAKSIIFILGLKKRKLDIKKFFEEDVEYKEKYNEFQITNEETDQRIFSIKNYVERREKGNINNHNKMPPSSIPINIYDLIFYIVTIYIAFLISKIILWPLIVSCVLLFIYIMLIYKNVDNAELSFLKALKKAEAIS